MSTFDRCADCRMCCRSVDSFVRIHVFSPETDLKRRLTDSGMDSATIVMAPGSTCRFLGPAGCTLGEIRPLHCRFYPLFLLPGDAIGIDTDCACSGEYISQLGDPNSDAGRHLASMKKAMSGLSPEEKRLLCDWSRYAIDVDIVAESPHKDD